MTTKYYLPRKEADRVIWLNNFASKIGTYAADFGISPGELLLIAMMALYYSYIIGLIQLSRTFTKALTSYKDVIAGGVTSTTVPAIPAFTPAVAPPITQTGIFTFIAGIVGRIKSNTTYYNTTVGDDLKIIGAETIFVPDDYKANGTCKAMEHYVEIDFVMTHLDAMDIYSNPIGGTDPTVWEKIGTVSHSGFHDLRPLANPGKPETRNYKTRGVIFDVEIGFSSDVFSVVYGG